MRDFSISIGFDHQGQLDEYLASLPEDETSQRIRRQLEWNRSELPTKADWDLIPEIIELVNKLVDMHPKLYQGGKKAARVYFDNHPNCYLTDNHQKLGRDLRVARNWLLQETGTVALPT